MLFSITSVSASDSDDFNVQGDIIESDYSQMGNAYCSTSNDVDDVLISNDPVLSGPSEEDSGTEEDDSSADGNGSDSGNDTEFSEVYSLQSFQAMQNTNP